MRKVLVVEVEGLKPITNTNQIQETHEFYNKLASRLNTCYDEKAVNGAEPRLHFNG